MADIVLILHFVWVLGVIVPVPLILLGRWLGWRWIRNFWIRTIHLGMMLFVALESVLGIVCPLTELEEALRQDPGGARYESSFLAYWLRRALYYDLDPLVFTIAYLVFALLIAGLYWRIPPRRRARSP